ncbi:general substrate transporter [Byssothecium circinans]|uniref:General substrate transporter n=1 Tax=Byssothecium circinans TaxID=147558 RepID=A0A6A5U597_9PLEO|nr:general substrate transporter [Byssothecium circinans]
MADAKDAIVKTEPMATATSLSTTPDASGAAAVVNSSQLLKDFEARQHSLTRKEAILEHWKSIAWCFYMFFTCITYGFDSLAGGVVIGIAKFREDFGYPFAGDYVVDASWQLGFLAATLGGIVLGGLMTGVIISRFGRKICILIAYIISTGGIFLQFFSTTPAHFFGGKILTGIPLGVFATTAPGYSSEMAPLSIRGAVKAGVNFAIVLGQLIGYGVQRQSAFYDDSRQYKVLFATQWGYVIIGLAILPFLPESPYWLVAHHKNDKARETIVKLHAPGYDVGGHMAEVHDSLARMNADNEAQGTMAECLTRKNLRRTMLGGMTPARSFDTTVGMSALMVGGNIFGWLFIEWFGRRGSALFGSAALTLILLLIGILAVIDKPGAIWGQAAFMALWGFVYQITMVSGLSSCIWSFSLPYAINPDQGNLGGKIAFVFGAVMAVSCVFIWFFVPETKGRTWIEIDELYKRGVPAWRWQKTEVVMVVEGDDKHMKN